MLLRSEECLPDLCCPITKSGLTRRGEFLFCSSVGPEPTPRYPMIEGKPILIDFKNSVVEHDSVTSIAALSQVKRASYSGASRVLKRLLSPEVKATKRNVLELKKLLTSLPKPARLLVVGGGTIGNSMDLLYDDDRIQVFSFDIYVSPFVQFIADAHAMPLHDDFFDAVVIQAVLEHVLQPEAVVAEIWRVLKPDGLVYAETPFMQQVHEGAFDFTRFTDSGHRFLFRRFDLIASGICGGPGVQLMWSADYFARAVFRSRVAGKLAKLAFSWAQWFDLIIPHDYAIDAASGVFFFGKKSSSTISASDVITYYQGAY